MIPAGCETSLVIPGIAETSRLRHTFDSAVAGQEVPSALRRHAIVGEYRLRCTAMPGVTGQHQLKSLPASSDRVLIVAVIAFSTRASIGQVCDEREEDRFAAAEALERNVFPSSSRNCASSGSFHDVLVEADLTKRLRYALGGAPALHIPRVGARHRAAGEAMRLAALSSAAALQTFHSVLSCVPVLRRRGCLRRGRPR
jgi:hypothetical protein